MCNCKINMRKRIGARKGASVAAVQQTIVTEVAPAALGYLLGEVLDKQLTLFTNKPTTANAIKIGAGLALTVFMEGFVARAGVGLAANGAIDFARPMLEKAGVMGMNGISLLNPGERGYYVAGAQPQSVEQFKMQ